MNIISLLSFITLSIMSQLAFAADELEFAGYITAWRCSNENPYSPCSALERIDPQNFTVVLHKGLNNDVYGHHLVTYQEAGYGLAVRYFIHKLDWENDYSVTLSIEVRDPDGKESTYPVGVVRISDTKEFSPIKIFGKEFATQKTNIKETLAPYVFFGKKGETFFGLNPRIQY